MDGSFAITIEIVIAVAAGISAQLLGESLRIPSIVFLLLLGILLGPDGWLHLLHPHRLGDGLETIVALSVAVILFEGGLNLELRDLGKVSGSLQRLVTLGTLITLLGGGMAAHWLGEFPWPLAFLYASLVVVTGPTVIGPLLKQVAVDRQVATLLEGEGVLIDPVGAILAVLVLETIVNAGTTGAIEFATGLLLRLVLGTAIGAGGALAMAWALRHFHFLSEDLKNLMVLAGVWGLFGLSQSLLSESGLMAMVVAGIVLRAASVPEERLLRRFKGQLTLLMVSMLFVLLSADLSIASIIALGWGSVFTVLALMLAIRPLSVAICTWGSGLNWRQKLFVSWVAPKGIVSASVASLFAILLTQRGLNGGDSLKAIVFLTIMMTVFLQGLTARWVARGLQITQEEATGAVIVGCNPLGRTIACLFQEQGESVVAIDTDPEACQKAREDGLRVFESSALNAEVLEEAGIDSIGTFLAVTSNSEVNLVLAQHALEEFQPPRVYAVYSPGNTNGGTTANLKTKVSPAFDLQFSAKLWNQYLLNGQVKLGKTTLKEEGLAFQQAHLRALMRTGELLPLLVKRRQRLQVVKAGEEWQHGDEIVYLLHDPRPKLLKRLSGGTQSARLAIATLSEVEEVPLAAAIVVEDSKS